MQSNARPALVSLALFAAVKVILSRRLYPAFQDAVSYPLPRPETTVSQQIVCHYQSSPDLNDFPDLLYRPRVHCPVYRCDCLQYLYPTATTHTTWTRGIKQLRINPSRHTAHHNRPGYSASVLCDSKVTILGRFKRSACAQRHVQC